LQLEESSIEGNCSQQAKELVSSKSESREHCSIFFSYKKKKIKKSKNIVFFFFMQKKMKKIKSFFQFYRV